MQKIIISIFLLTLFIIPATLAKNSSNNDDNTWELRANRTYASNFKDMVLARCVSKAYQFDKKVVKDTNGSAGALFIMWIGSVNYDVFPDVDTLITTFLKRKYYFHEHNDLQGDMMKCLDLYHSNELNSLVKKYISKPSMTLKKEQ